MSPSNVPDVNTTRPKPSPTPLPCNIMSYHHENKLVLAILESYLHRNLLPTIIMSSFQIHSLKLALIQPKASEFFLNYDNNVLTPNTFPDASKIQPKPSSFDFSYNDNGSASDVSKLVV